MPPLKRKQFLLQVSQNIDAILNRSGTNVTVRIPVPKATISASHEPLGPGQTSELKHQDKINIWKIKKIDGGAEQILILKVSRSRVHTL